MKNPNAWNFKCKKEFTITPYQPDMKLNEKILLIRNDITTLPVECIVNAANERLRGGGGIDGAIHRACGHELFDYLCAHYNHCDTGDFRPTPAFNLPSEEILHAVGPVGEQPTKLQEVYLNCMRYVKATNKKSIAFPCISTGIFGYDNQKACPVVCETIRFWLQHNPDWNGLIVFCVFSETDYAIYRKNLTYFFPGYTSTIEAFQEYKKELLKEKDLVTQQFKEAIINHNEQQAKYIQEREERVNKRLLESFTLENKLQTTFPMKDQSIEERFKEFAFIENIEFNKKKRIIQLWMQKNAQNNEIYPIIKV